jgi:hypothetical protein
MARELQGRVALDGQIMVKSIAERDAVKLVELDGVLEDGAEEFVWEAGDVHISACEKL